MNDHATLLWEYFSRLDRPGVVFVNSNRSVDQVYADVKGYDRQTRVMRKSFEERMRATKEARAARLR